MNIWDILKIPPTTDTKAIKKAYAKLAKTCHPEEMPEEFKRLYAAYQAAIDYANGRRRPSPADIARRETPQNGERAGDVPRQSNTQRTSPETPGHHDEIFRAFREAEMVRREFVRKWDDFFPKRRRQEIYQLLTDYLDSEAFRSICYDPQVIKHIVDSIEQEWRPSGEIYHELWKRYAFEKSNASRYQGEVRLLYHCIEKKMDYLENEAQRKRRREEEEKRQEQRQQRMRRIATVVIPALIAAVTFGAFCANAIKNRNMHRELVGHLETTYPHTRFAISDGWSNLDSGRREYICYSEEFLDMEVVVRVEKSREGYRVSDNYGSQVLPRYAGEYGLRGFACDTSQGPCWMFYYPSLQDDGWEEFLNLFQAFLESDEWQRLPAGISISFCPETALFPETIVQGGKGGLPEPLLLATGEVLNAENLRQKIADSYIAYMMNYESWNLSAALYEQCADRYNQLYSLHPPGIRRAGYGSSDGYDYILRMRQESGFPLHAYVVTKSTPIPLGEQTYYQTNQVGYITVGNVFSYLVLCGMDVRVNADGSGFSVYRDGQVHLFGQGCDSQEFPANEIYKLTK